MDIDLIPEWSSPEVPSHHRLQHQPELSASGAQRHTSLLQEAPLRSKFSPYPQAAQHSAGVLRHVGFTDVPQITAAHLRSSVESTVRARRLDKGKGVDRPGRELSTLALPTLTDCTHRNPVI